MAQPLLEKTIEASLVTLSHFVPFGEESHRVWIHRLLPEVSPNWGAATENYAFWIAAALTILFRHEVLGAVFGVLKMVAERRRPQVVDERIGLIVLSSLLPVFFLSSIPKFEHLDGLSLPLFAVTIFLCGWAKKKHHFYDWNWKEALLLALLLVISRVTRTDLPLVVILAGLVFSHTWESISRMMTLWLTASAWALAAHFQWAHSDTTRLFGNWDLPKIAAITTCILVTFLGSKVITRTFALAGARGVLIYGGIVSLATLALSQFGAI